MDKNAYALPFAIGRVVLPHEAYGYNLHKQNRFAGYDSYRNSYYQQHNDVSDNNDYNHYNWFSEIIQF